MLHEQHTAILRLQCMLTDEQILSKKKNYMKKNGTNIRLDHNYLVHKTRYCRKLFIKLR